VPDSEASPLDSLIQQAQTGDEEARNALFHKVRAYIGFIARSHVESWLQAKVDSSDLVQQTLLEAHQGFGKFGGSTEGELLAWLKRILRNNATDFVRRFGAQKRKANREVAIDQMNSSESMASPELSGNVETPSVILSKREEEIEVANALATLPEDYQDVIVLRNLQRLPFAEIGERMDRSPAAVQMLWGRAIKRLQECLNQSDSTDS
jgi:RNA polymerase sigma-70 factor (ECF subfamily)